MKATIDFDESLYRRLKVEAARRGRTVRELVAEGVRTVLDAPDRRDTGVDDATPWFGSLRKYARSVDDHSMSAIRGSVTRERSSSKLR